MLPFTKLTPLKSHYQEAKSSSV